MIEADTRIPHINTVSNIYAKVTVSGQLYRAAVRGPLGNKVRIGVFGNGIMACAVTVAPLISSGTEGTFTIGWDEKLVAEVIDQQRVVSLLKYRPLENSWVKQTSWPVVNNKAVAGTNLISLPSDFIGDIAWYEFERTQLQYQTGAEATGQLSFTGFGAGSQIIKPVETLIPPLDPGIAAVTPMTNLTGGSGIPDSPDMEYTGAFITFIHLNYEEDDLGQLKTVNQLLRWNGTKWVS